MAKRIVIVQGHPDPAGGHLSHALADAYEAGAREAGHEVDVVQVAGLALPLLQTKAEFERPAPPEVARVQERIAAAHHIVIVFPLWLGGMPAVLKGALEQILRPSFALLEPNSGWRGKRRLAGISARVVVTMGMPALAFRFWFGAHGVRTFDRAILGLVGIRPVRKTYLGGVETASDATRAGWLAAMRDLGRAAK